MEASDTPHDVSGFEFHGSPVPLVNECCSTDIDNEADRAVRLFLFERCSETIGAGITMQAERSRLVDNSVPIGKEKYRWSCEFPGKGANYFVHGGSKDVRGPFLSGAVIERVRLAMLGRNLR